LITREYALFCLGRFVSQAVGEHTFYTKINLSYGKAVESAKSNALMRCCKDLGVASELWDPSVNYSLVATGLVVSVLYESLGVELSCSLSLPEPRVH
jgi:hypothetical protein